MSKLKQIIGGVVMVLMIGITIYIFANLPSKLESLRQAVTEEQRVYDEGLAKLKASELRLTEKKISSAEEQLNVWSKTDIKSYQEQSVDYKNQLREWYKKLSKPFVDVYRTPYDLYYAFMRSDGVTVTQSETQHIRKDSFYATDIAPYENRQMDVYCPDMWNREEDWNIEARQYPDTSGDSVLLVTTNGLMQILIGHTTLVKTGSCHTGEKIGYTNLTGKFQGEPKHHIHVEYYTRPVKDVPFQLINYTITDTANKHEVINRTNKIIPQANASGDNSLTTTKTQPVVKSSTIKATSYNPEQGQTDSTPCISGSGKDICELAKQGIRTIALSRDLLRKYPYGTKITINSELDDSRCKGEFLVADTMNARYTNRADLFFMERKDNVSCLITIK